MKRHFLSWRRAITFTVIACGCFARTHTTFGVQTESTYDWAATKWTVPLIAPVSQVLKIRGLPISLQLAPKWYAEGPTLAPDWGIRFAVTLLFPKK